jgi:hypothetical protein
MYVNEESPRQGNNIKDMSIYLVLFLGVLGSIAVCCMMLSIFVKIGDMIIGW